MAGKTIKPPKGKAKSATESKEQTPHEYLDGMLRIIDDTRNMLENTNNDGIAQALQAQLESHCADTLRLFEAAASLTLHETIREADQPALTAEQRRAMDLLCLKLLEAEEPRPDDAVQDFLHEFEVTLSAFESAVDPLGGEGPARDRPKWLPQKREILDTLEEGKKPDVAGSCIID